MHVLYEKTLNWPTCARVRCEKNVSGGGAMLKSNKFEGQVTYEFCFRVRVFTASQPGLASDIGGGCLMLQPRAFTVVDL